jgi:hypothetical protein
LNFHHPTGSDASVRLAAIPHDNPQKSASNKNLTCIETHDTAVYGCFCHFSIFTV